MIILTIGVFPACYRLCFILICGAGAGHAEFEKKRASCSILIKKATAIRSTACCGIC
ncbi:hypothetical protein KCP69_00320 [Salmonella enterica subsp. enterica]|nr:hypothetical protein KCP69_00320 [Salmonella enterica subsp. enterica]